MYLLVSINLTSALLSLNTFHYISGSSKILDLNFRLDLKGSRKVSVGKHKKKSFLGTCLLCRFNLEMFTISLASLGKALYSDVT